MITDYYDRMAVGDQHATRARTITETDLVTFAMFSGDWHPLHTDTHWAANDDRFGQRIAHGALVLSVALGLVTFWPQAMQAFYGIDQLRFVYPVGIGDTLHVRTRVNAIEPRGDATAVVTVDFEVRNHQGQAVLAAFLHCLVRGSEELR